MRKIIYYILVISLSYSCTHKIDCEIVGYIQTEKESKLSEIEIGQMAKNSPINYTELKLGKVIIDEKGFFSYKIRKVKRRSDKNFLLYFKKEGFNKLIVPVNLYDNVFINLDTLILKQKEG
ncbi:hypothetical protein [Tenacibaculum ascidiaceicola]|uniref:hypothetical protein n=1 Tax=Tenacibaculum ascidiaceicola TaxID=1699411 RepID=UPI0038966488